MHIYLAKRNVKSNVPCLGWSCSATTTCSWISGFDRSYRTDAPMVLDFLPSFRRRLSSLLKKCSSFAQPQYTTEQR